MSVKTNPHHLALGLLTVLLLGVLTGCGEPDKPVQVDAPLLAGSLRWVGTCAVLCSTIGGICLVLASNRRK